MAGIFSLGSATNHSQQDHTTNTSDPSTRRSSSSLLYGTTTTTTRNIHDDHLPTTTTTKDFDFWQQAPDTSNLLAAPASMGGGGDGDGDHGDGRFINFSNDPTWGSAAVMMMSHGGGFVSCRDCGNQAKKDCTHLRCRTCCKSRGFQCQTHVKSTWVPVIKRRERQQCLPATQQADHSRRCLLPTTQKTRSAQDAAAAAAAAASTVAYNSSSSGMEVGNFPSEVITQADFRCVRVSSIDEDDHDQFACQAVVNIHGHLFKGILYDQGPEDQYMSGDNTSSGGSRGIPPLNPTSISPSNSTTGLNFMGHSLFASLGGNDYLTSTQFFHQISRE